MNGWLCNYLIESLVEWMDGRTDGQMDKLLNGGVGL